MRFLKIIIIVCFFAGVSCNKKIDLTQNTFDVVATGNTYKAGDTTNFLFFGNPDVITFYSGEIGRRYQFRNRVSDTSTNLQLKFSTATTVATSGSLSLLVSNNYSGVKDSTNIYNATWTDITARATLATGTATVASGTISLTDFAQQQKPVYIAFKYSAAAAATQRKWTITALTLNHVISDTTYTITDLTLTAPAAYPSYTASTGWTAANIRNTAINWTPTTSTSATTSLVITGATTTTAAVATEDWIIAGPIDLTRVIPDGGIVVKDITQQKTNYSYQYLRPGSYTATFFSANANRDRQDTLTRSINLTVK
ncbi:DUF5017 domain-containing protein [Chitinophagaceae bacterium LWZ2-11]